MRTKFRLLALLLATLMVLSACTVAPAETMGTTETTAEITTTANTDAEETTTEEPTTVTEENTTVAYETTAEDTATVEETTSEETSSEERVSTAEEISSCEEDSSSVVTEKAPDLPAEIKYDSSMSMSIDELKAQLTLSQADFDAANAKLREFENAALAVAEGDPEGNADEGMNFSPEYEYVNAIYLEFEDMYQMLPCFRYVWAFHY